MNTLEDEKDTNCLEINSNEKKFQINESNNDCSIAHNDENKLLRILQNIPKSYHLYIVICLILSLNITTVAIPVYLRKYGMSNKIDLSFLTLFRVIIPAVLNIVTANYLEGSFALFTNVRESFTLLFFGILTNGLSPLTSHYIAIEINANLASMYGQLFPIVNSIGSYIFKVEPLPQKKSLGSIILFIGLLISLVSSLFTMAFGLYPQCHQAASHTKYFIAGTLALLSLILQAFYINYQIINYTKNPKSRFFNKPLTLIAVCSMEASLVLGPCSALVCYNRYNKVYHNLNSCSTWISMTAVVVISSYISNVIVSICNLLTSPLFVSAVSIPKVFFGFGFSYLILGEVLNPAQIYLIVPIMVGLLVLIIGKRLLMLEKDVKKYITLEEDI